MNMNIDHRIPLSALAQCDTLIDVRTPAEFSKDHIEGAINLPVLSNNERQEVGKLYHQSPFLGRQKGAILIARNIADHLEKTLLRYPKHWKPIIYCWRGGKRSGAFTHILRQIGWAAGQLHGGYKTYRRMVIDFLNDQPQHFRFIVIGGKTGSGKSLLLQELSRQGAQVLDLENLAKHKGSLLGQTPYTAQPSQCRFESLLYQALRCFVSTRPVFIESESRRIGQCHLPESLMHAIRIGRFLWLDAEMSVRVSIILNEYADHLKVTNWLASKIDQFACWHSHARLQQWQQWLVENDWARLAESLMQHHYDPAYQKSLSKHFDIKNAEIFKLTTHESITAIATQLRSRFDSAS